MSKLKKCSKIKGGDVSAGHLVKDIYEGDAVTPMNKRNTKDPRKLPVGNPICGAGLAMSKDGKTSHGHGGLCHKF